MEEWIESVTSEDRTEAEEIFKTWQDDNQEWFSKLSPDDIRIDTIRTQDKKCITRYMVKKK